MPKNMRISAGTPAVWEVYLDCQVSKQVGGYDALWEQETAHEWVEQCGTRVMRHERPWTRQHWINAA
jgi:hypothetical protein